MSDGGNETLETVLELRARAARAGGQAAVRALILRWPAGLVFDVGLHREPADAFWPRSLSGPAIDAGDRDAADAEQLSLLGGVVGLVWLGLAFPAVRQLAVFDLLAADELGLCVGRDVIAGLSCITNGRRFQLPRMKALIDHFSSVLLAGGRVDRRLAEQIAAEVAEREQREK